MIKKFTANILIIIYLMFFNIASGIASELYYIKDATKSNIAPLVENTFKTNGYTLKNTNPIYGVKSAFEAVAIIQQSQNDVYYYYNSTNDAKLNKNILNAIKNTGKSYKKISDSTVLSSFDKEVIQLKKSQSNQTKVYNFNNTTSSTVSTITQNNNILGDSQDSLKGYIAKIPTGTAIEVYLQTTVNTAVASKGDEVIAVLSKNWEYNGNVIAEQGSTITGVITKASHAGLAYKNGYVKFNFNKLKTVSGREYSLSTEDIEFKVDSDGRAKDAATRVVAGAAIGALTGLLIGALWGDSSVGKSTAISAGAGAVLGAGSAVMEQGTDAEIPTYTEMSIKLTAPLKVMLSY